MKNETTEKPAGPGTEETRNSGQGGKPALDVLEISNAFYVVSYDGSKRGFSVVDGPFAERHWAVSHARLNET